MAEAFVEEQEDRRDFFPTVNNTETGMYLFYSEQNEKSIS